jgi:hypothetical protein
VLVVAFGLCYALLAYIALPSFWAHRERQSKLAGMPMVTHKADGLPGDPLNVGVIGSREDVVKAMHQAGWDPADPVTLRTSLDIVGSVVLDRPYHDAPVSPLFVDGRREDLAFEKPDGQSADRRQHVRFWKVLENGAENRPVWLGAATFDRGIGFSHYTGQITHHIDPKIDAERDALASDLEKARMVQTVYQVSGVGPTLFGRNGEGDPYQTDGEIRMLVLVPGGKPNPMLPVTLPDPPLIDFKNRIWRQLGN